MREQEWVVITGIGSVSGLGATSAEVLESYVQGTTTFTTLPALGAETPVSQISPSAEDLRLALLQENPIYTSLDRSVQLAILAARQAVAQAGWSNEDKEITAGINIGSSRGATGLFEQFHQEFLQHPDQRLSPVVSPSTTLGNVASWVANDLQASGPLISHSVTCSTALQAVANGLAWLKAGMAKRFLVGGTEAPLTPFTLAQMKSIGIYSKYQAHENPCRPLNQEHQNTFVLGEGAAVFALERLSRAEMEMRGMSHALVVLAVGMGYERSPSKTGISGDGAHFQLAMRDALSQAALSPSEIDALVVHAPGTRAGDAAEIAAVKAVFTEKFPVLYSNKGLIGHTLGASGALSAHLAFLLLSGASASEIPSLLSPYSSLVSPQHLLVNAAGFGGNSASLLLSRSKI